MKRISIFILALVVLAISCGQSADQVETEAPPADMPEEISQPVEDILPTDTEAPAKAPSPSDTPDQVIEGQIKPGMYIVGIDEDQIASGIYFGEGASCYWERLSGLGGTFDEIIANAGPEGQFYVEIQETDVAFSIDRCTITPLDNIPAPIEFEMPVEPGMYLIGRDIESGLYQGTGDSCYWERLSGLGGTFDDIIANDGPDGQFYVEVKDTDLAFTLTRCSMTQLDQISPPPEFLTHLEPGMYLVGRDIEAGLYQGSGEDCYWERLKNVSGGFDGIIANDGPDGSFFVEIAPNDFAFRINHCSVDLVE